MEWWQKYTDSEKNFQVMIHSWAEKYSKVLGIQQQFR